MLRIPLTLSILFSVKKASLSTCNSVCYSLYPEEAKDLQETYICSSLWQLKQDSGFNPRLRHALKFLLLLAGDIELCPGPRVHCSGCLKAIHRTQLSKVCESCGTLFHVKCLTDKLEGRIEKFYCSSCVVNIEHEAEEECDTNVPLYPQLSSYLCRRGLKILHQNVNGLLSKLDQVKILLTETDKNIHMFKITESHLDSSISDSQLSIFGYNIIRKDRQNGPGGGVCIFIRDYLNWQRRYDLEKDDIETIVVEIFINCSKSLLISVVYRPPDSSKYLNRNFDVIFNDFITTAVSEDKEFILSGDINCDYLKSDHRDIKNNLKITGLKQLIDEPTRVTQHTSTLIDKYHHHA